MSSDIKPAPGYYNGKILNYGMKTTQAGLPAPTIALEVTDAEGAKHRVFWQGSLKDGRAMEITLEALMVCGLKDIRAFKSGAFCNGLDSGLLDIRKEYSISVVHETSMSDPNKRYARVQWINAEGSAGAFKDAIVAGEGAQLMAGMALEGAFFEIAKKLGVKPGATQEQAAEKPPVVNPADIPF